MINKLLLLVLILGYGVGAAAQSAPPSSLTGEELRSWLKTNWYDGFHNSLAYDGARRAMYSYIDKAEDGNVYCVYTGYYQPASNTTFLNPINAEHTVPQSWFNEQDIPRADIFHLFPTHMDVNAERGSYPFDEIPDSSTDSWYVAINNSYTETFSIPGENINSYSELDNGLRFEPREEHKGDLARAVFYFYTMYPTQAGNISQIMYNDLETLYNWHLQDPVSDWELQRNNRIAERQGNQNPYIVYPNLVCSAWGFTCQAGPELFAVENDQFNSFGIVQFESGNYPTQSFRIINNGITEDLIISSPSGFQIALADNREFVSELVLPTSFTEHEILVRFKPLAASNRKIEGFVALKNENVTYSIPVEGTEGDPNLQPIAVLTESFDDCSSNSRDWQAISVASNKDWECNSNAGYQGSGFNVNGFRGDGPSEDWLISPIVESNGKPITISAWVYTRYRGPELEVVYSENYSGSGNPNQANWNTLNVSLPNEDSQSWTRIQDEISVSGNFYLAFKYTTIGTNAGAAASWSVDEVEFSSIPELSASFYAPDPVIVQGAEETRVYVRSNKKVSQDTEVLLEITEGSSLVTNGGNGTVEISKPLEAGRFALTIPAGDSVAYFNLSTNAQILASQEVTFRINSYGSAQPRVAPVLTVQVPESDALGFKDRVVASRYRVFPNPISSNKFSLSNAEELGSGLNLRLLSPSGQEVWTAKTNNHKPFLLSSSLKNGLYILLIEEPNGKVSFQKVLIIK
jgi:endonuclease I